MQVEKNGLHGFSETGAFPPDQQNRTVYVVDIESQQVYSRDLDQEDSGLNIEEIDRLSVTNSQFFQHHDTLYLSGGYGINSTTGDFETKSFLTAIDISLMIEWVVNPKKVQTAASAIRQVNHPSYASNWWSNVSA